MAHTAAIPQDILVNYYQPSYLRNQQVQKVHQYTDHQKLRQLEYTCDKNEDVKSVTMI
jgi:hypothetical protein